MNYKAVTLGLVLAGTALGSAALNVGRARGAAWIGQPLELTIPVQLDPGQTDTALCAEADVFHGDSRQDGSRVQVQVVPSDQPDTVNLKISSSALIDEPVVSVYLRAGCTQKSSRKFVLLADFPSDMAAGPSRAVTPSAPIVPTVVPAETLTSPAPVPAAPGTLSASPNPASKPAKTPKAAKAPKVAVNDVKETREVAKEVPAPAVPEAVKPVAAPAPPVKEAPPKPPKAEKPVEAAPPAKAKPERVGKPHLRLDPIETLSERVKSLEATTTGTSLQDDIARDGQKMQALQADLRTLLDQAAKNEASLAAMRERLEKAESDRVPVVVVYGLVALVVLALGALVFLWNKRPRQVVWKSADGPGAKPSKSVDVDVDLN